MSLADLDAWDLNVFVTAISKGGLTAAAKHLNLSQSTISRRIASLEKVVGARLLVRNREGVLPTEVGRRVIAAASGLEEILGRVQSIRTRLADNATVHVSASEGIGGYWMPICLAGFADDHPEICMRIDCTNVGHEVDVTRAEADIAVSYVEPTDPDVVVLGRGRLTGRLFASEDYVARFGLPHTLDEISEHRVCAHEMSFSGHIGNGDWARFAEILSVHKNVTYRVNSGVALGFAIRSGWGIGAQPSMLASTETGLVMLPANIYSSYADFWLVAHRDGKDNPATRVVIDWMKNRFMQRAERGMEFEVA